jgi:hypothetical protein
VDWCEKCGAIRVWYGKDKKWGAWREPNPFAIEPAVSIQDDFTVKIADCNTSPANHASIDKKEE